MPGAATIAIPVAARAVGRDLSTQTVDKVSCDVQGLRSWSHSDDGTGLPGRVHTGAKGTSVHSRYRFDGESREMPLGT